MISAFVNLSAIKWRNGTQRQRWNSRLFTTAVWNTTARSTEDKIPNTLPATQIVTDYLKWFSYYTTTSRGGKCLIGFPRSFLPAETTSVPSLRDICRQQVCPPDMTVNSKKWHPSQSTADKREKPVMAKLSNRDSHRQRHLRNTWLTKSRLDTPVEDGHWWTRVILKFVL